MNTNWQEADLDDIPPYSFDFLVSEFKLLISMLPDARTGLNKRYTMADASLGAFSVFFMQSPSFLAHQSKLQECRGHNNAKSLFQIQKILSDNQIRNLLDPVEPCHITPMFDYVFNGLNSLNYFAHYKSINDTVLISVDGVNYFTSNKINCDNCSVSHHKTGEICYAHNAITPIIAAPNNPHVISLTPELITPQDGHSKQDSEQAAFKRWLKSHGYKYKSLGITILGDDLYSHQPICEAVLQEEFHFIFVCKPDSHTTIYKNIQNLESIGKIRTLNINRTEGKRVIREYTDTYRFVNNIPIRDTKDTLYVNWCELIITNSDGDIVFINSYITDHEVTTNNVAQIVQAGRTRWKSENENNNVQKNHGYNIEHNFGHGKQYLSQTLLVFNILAFLFHTVLDILDTKYMALREKLPTRRIFFEHIRALTTYHYYNSWDELLQYMLEGLENKKPLSAFFNPPNNTKYNSTVNSDSTTN